MQRISAGSGKPRYTLYFPLQLERLALPIDMNQLARDLMGHLGLQVLASEGNGWKQLKIGPFNSEQEAMDAFQRTVRTLSMVCVDGQYPLFFESSLWPLDVPSERLTIFGNDEPIDARAHLTLPVIVPEHKQIYDSGLMLGHVNPQMTPQQLTDAIGKAGAATEPLSPKTAAAMQAYVTACATPFPMMKFVGFVMALETLCQGGRKSELEQVALRAIGNVVAESRVGDLSDRHKSMKDLALNLIRGGEKLSITAQVRQLVIGHAESVRRYLANDDPWGDELKQGVNAMYKARSAIVHSGAWGEMNRDEVHRVMRFAIACAKGVLADRLTNDVTKFVEA